MSIWAVALALISLLAGVALGLRFKVLVLVPAIACVLLIALGVGILGTDTLWSAVLSAAAATGSLQIGYLAGGGIRHALNVIRISGLRSASLGGSQTARRGAH